MENIGNPLKPVSKKGWAGIQEFLWDKKTGRILGRTCCSWFKIILFYIVYYTFLALYFSTMMYIFLNMLDDRSPKWKLDDGVIGNNPGMGFRPRPAHKVDSNLIHFRHGNYNSNWKPWAKAIDTYFEDYKEMSEKKPDIVECSYERSPLPGQVCNVSKSELLQGPCISDNGYGFKDGTPCILIKLNKIYDWIPDTYCNSSELPRDVPSQLRTFVEEKEKTKDPMVGRSVFVYCEGANPADKENLGELQFFPQPAIPDFHYPYQNQYGYVNPLLFVHLTNPKHGVLISVECKAWAKNIEHDTSERIGLTNFELLID